jgi:hypothetical protein
MITLIAHVLAHVFKEAAHEGLGGLGEPLSSLKHRRAKVLALDHNLQSGK